jgi:hypothetical protein
VKIKIKGQRVKPLKRNAGTAKRIIKRKGENR